MASGHASRANRPNTWLHRPATRREVLTCQPGAVHTWHLADESCSARGSGSRSGWIAQLRAACHQKRPAQKNEALDLVRRLRGRRRRRLGAIAEGGRIAIAQALRIVGRGERHGERRVVIGDASPERERQQDDQEPFHCFIPVNDWFGYAREILPAKRFTSPLASCPWPSF